MGCSPFTRPWDRALPGGLCWELGRGGGGFLVSHRELPAEFSQGSIPPWCCACVHVCHVCWPRGWAAAGGFAVTRVDVGWLLPVPRRRCWGRDARGTLHKPSVLHAGVSEAPSSQWPGPPPRQRPGVGGCAPWVLAGLGGTQACLTPPCAVMGHERPRFPAIPFHALPSRAAGRGWWPPGSQHEPSLGDRLPRLAFGTQRLE